MGRGDNRRTRKVVQRAGQRKKKSRLAKRIELTRQARASTRKSARG